MSMLFRPGTFSRGVHPEEHKGTASLPIRRMPFVGRYVLPLLQHIGTPMRAVVTVGQRVARAQTVAEPGGLLSTTLHSPVTGTVVALHTRPHPLGGWGEAIEIETDRFASQRLPRAPMPWASLSRSEFVRAVQAAGLVGMGGAAFPTHVKYAPIADKPLRWLLVNGCECEPYLTSDHRLMLERPEAVIRGACIVMEKLDLEAVEIGVEANKQDAIEALEGASRDHDRIRIVPLRVKYPQGAEKMLIKAVFGKEVPAGGLPVDIGIVVNNVATIAAIAEYFERGAPLVERVVTVAGSGVDEPANLLVPIGAPVRDVLQYAGLREDARQVVMGGPMMGVPLASLDVPILKGTSGLLAFADAELEGHAEYPCLRCGRCLDACASSLNPARLAKLARHRRYEELEALFVADCMECGACTYACPSGIPIVHLIRTAKAALRERKVGEC